MTYLDRISEYALTLEEGVVEVANADSGESQISVFGKCQYEAIPSFEKAYELFGPTKIAILAKPRFDGSWAIALVSIR